MNKTAKNMSAYMWGWHGQMNTGDDAFSIVVSWMLRKYANAKNIFIQCDNSNLLKKRYEISTIEKKVPGLTRLYNSYVKSRLDYFVLSGGSLLSSKREVDDLFRMSKYLLEQNKNIFSLGISVGPFSSTEHEKAVKSYLETMSFVGFRDDLSYNWACSQGLKTPFKRAFDLALLLPRAVNYFDPKEIYYKDENIKSSKVLGISLLAFNAQQDPANFCLDLDLAKYVAESTHRVAKALGFKIKLYALSSNSWSDDRLICEAFLDAYPNSQDVSIYTHRGDAWETFQSMKSCSHFLSMRLHGSVFSYMNQVPNIVLSYHPKCKSFAKTLGYSDEFILDVSKFDRDVFANSLAVLLETSELTTSLTLEDATSRSELNLEFSSYLK